MELKNIILKINLFNVTDETEDYKVSEFFDNVGEDIKQLGNFTRKEKEILIKTFLNFLKRQSSDMDENWSFIHLIEWFDKPNYQFYNQLLIEFNKETPTLTSTILFIRHINFLEEEKDKELMLLKKISEHEKSTELIRIEVQDYLKKNNVTLH